MATISRLREIRKANKLTQEKAAALLHVSKSYYCKVEAGFCRAGVGFLDRFKTVFPYEDINIFFAGEAAKQGAKYEDSHNKTSA